MDWRCQNCGQHLLVEKSGADQPVNCPGCGAVVSPPPATDNGWRPRRVETDRAKAQRGLRRIFEPIPRPAAYLAGAVLALLLLSPFVAYLFQSSYQRGPVILSDDTELLPLPPPATQAVPHEAVLTAPMAAGVSLDRYRGLQLNAARDEAQGLFNLRLVNTRGMEPEIYEAGKAGDIEHVTAHFYNGQLKEFRLVLQEKQVALAAVEAELAELFGEPRDRADRPRATANGFGLPKQTGALEQKLESFPHQRVLRWFDRENQVEATIYTTDAASGRPTTMVAVQVTATRWLAANRSHLGSVAAPATNQPAAAAPTETRPPRLFP